MNENEKKEKNTPLLCAESRNQIKKKIIEKLLLSIKLRYLRGSHFSQCCLLSAARSIARYQVSFYASKDQIFSLGVSQHIHVRTKSVKIWAHWCSRVAR